jgi:putative glutamine amidotransferase
MRLADNPKKRKMNKSITFDAGRNSRSVSGEQDRPVVGVVANAGMDGRLQVQSVDRKYLDALMSVSDVAVLIIPALVAEEGTATVLESLDGILLTGAVSNIHPRHFDAAADEPRHSPFDHGRDQVALDLARRALERDMPLLAICRGMQELNVCRGGTLTPQIDQDQQRFCHGAWDKTLALQELYGPAHAVSVSQGGLLSDIVGTGPLHVNSLHVQAIDRLGDGLRVEAVADDGIIEAVSMPDKRFALGVQWHPEFGAEENDVSRQIFHAFGMAARMFHVYRALIARSKS